MNEILTFVLAVLGLTFLSAGWVAIQYLARKLKTKNHFDDLNTCTGCMCGGSGACEKK